MRLFTTLATTILTLAMSAQLAIAETTNIEKLKLVIDFPGTIEVLDDEKPSETKVRMLPSMSSVGTITIELKKKPSTPEDAKETIKIVSPDASNMVVSKLPDKGWLLTWQYSKDWFGVKVVKKVKGKWFVLDARPESREAFDAAIAAFKSVRAM